MNPLMQMLGVAMGSNGGNGRTNLFMQAIGAYSRGETPENFLKGLAKTDPRFQGINFDNLEKTANDLCRQKGVNKDQLIVDVQNEVNSIS